MIHVVVSSSCLNTKVIAGHAWFLALYSKPDFFSKVAGVHAAGRCFLRVRHSAGKSEIALLSPAIIHSPSNSRKRMGNSSS